MITFYSFGSSKDGPNQGVNPAFWLHHRSLAKFASRKNRSLLINEWLAANIAWYLRLPVPPFSMMRKAASSTRYFASLSFEEKNETTPSDLQPSIFCDQQTDLATGIILFDALIANPDRHEGNLKVDNPLNPVRVFVHDHDRELLGNNSKRGTDRLKKERYNLGIGSHCLAKVIETASYFEKWYLKIQGIPEPFIQTLCDEVRDLDASEVSANSCFEFVSARRTELPEIVKNSKRSFPKISDWRLYQ